MNEVSGKRDKSVGGSSDSAPMAEGLPGGDGKVGRPMAVGHLLDPNVQGHYKRYSCAQEVVTLPCGFQFALVASGPARKNQLRGHVLVGHRTAPNISLESCARITLDAAADMLDDLESRMAALEGSGVETAGESVPSADKLERADMVCTQVSDEGREGDCIRQSASFRQDDPTLCLNFTKRNGCAKCPNLFDAEKCRAFPRKDDDGGVDPSSETKILHITAAAGNENMGTVDTVPE